MLKPLSYSFYFSESPFIDLSTILVGEESRYGTMFGYVRETRWRPTWFVYVPRSRRKPGKILATFTDVHVQL